MRRTNHKVIGSTSYALLETWMTSKIIEKRDARMQVYATLNIRDVKMEPAMQWQVSKVRTYFLGW